MSGSAGLNKPGNQAAYATSITPAPTVTIAAPLSTQQSAAPSKLSLDIVRIKKLPQGEDEALPCSAAVRITCLESSEFVLSTDVQKGTNNPYFNQACEKELAASAPEHLNFLVEIVEHARASKPTSILFSHFSVDQAGASAAKTELTLFLTPTNPFVDAASAQQQAEKAAAAPNDAPIVVIRYKLVAPRFAKPVFDPNADVVLDYVPEMHGGHRIVHKHAPFAWVNLVSDQAWCDAFAHCAIETWKAMPSLSVQIKRMSIASGIDLSSTASTVKKASGGGGKSALSPRGGSAGGEKGGGIKSMSDVVFTAWYCKRSHQLLTRLRISAEKFIDGEESIAFTLDDELHKKRMWKERAMLRMLQCRRAFEPTGGSDKLRVMFDRLWMLMAAGVPPDGPTPNLPFDVRHKLSQAQFTKAQAETLLACLIQRLAPWLSYQECDVLAKDDADPRILPSSVRNVPFPPIVADVKAAPQLCFVDVISSFVGRIVDTLTDMEFATAVEYFIPAIREAYVRCTGSPVDAGAAAVAGASKGNKKERSGSAKKKKGQKEGGSTAESPMGPAAAGAGQAAGIAITAEEKLGDGLTIKHLDKLGRRVDEPKFA